ncbi:hypothetical protein P3G55_11980 [Leptospira sp. 96542]|nr:hypothetical protein [Leptospira sp. 96542]
MKKTIVILPLIALFVGTCKPKTKEIEIKTEFRNSKIGFDFFCNPEENTNLNYYENNREMTEYLTVFECKLNKEFQDYNLLIYSMPDHYNGIWLTLSEVTCINNDCVLKQKPKKDNSIDEDPDGELRFKVINKDVIKLVYSNVRQTTFQEIDDVIPYHKAKDYIDVKRGVYVFRDRPWLKDCPVERTKVDTVGDLGVYCGEETAETKVESEAEPVGSEEK